MPTDDIAIELRPRDDWEAADLGLELARTWVVDLAAAWSLAYAMPALLLVAISPRPIATAIVVWWCRPWAERALIEVLARRCFGRRSSIAAALRAVVRAPRRFGPWIASLTWRRFSPVRTIWLAVWELEGLQGRAARERMRVLTARGRGVAAWCVAIVTLGTALIVVALDVTILALIPDPTGTMSLDWLTSEARMTPAEARLGALLVVAADALCAPWLTATLFGLYVSRRTELEAWDIELVFRRLARRIAVTGAALLTAATLTTGAYAQPVAPPGAAAPVAAPTAFDPAVAIARILAQPEFGREETVRQWRLRPGRPRSDGSASPWLAWLVGTVPVVARALRTVMWAVAALVVGWLVLAVWRSRGRRARTRVEDQPAATELEGPASTWPADRDVLVRARACAEAGLMVDALGLLYRGALRACHERGAMEVHPGDTEADCLGQVQGLLAPEAERALRDVVRAWQSAAYARHTPSRERVLAMCDAYGRHFGERTA